MLKQRLLTAAILIPLVVWGVLALPNTVFALLLAVIVIAGFWEWAGLMGIAETTDRLVYILIAIPLMWFGGTLPGGMLAGASVGAVWWLVAIAWMLRFNIRPVTVQANIVTAGGAGMLTLVPAWMALVVLHGSESYGPKYVLFLMVLVWVADSGAYFAGRLWGSHKLASNISPGKTWEGVWGALAMTMVMGLAGARLLGVDPVMLPAFVSLCVITVAFSIAGDLFESMFKRRAGVKDSGKLLPGHGGVLDRIDSLTAAAPVFLTGLLLLGMLR